MINNINYILARALNPESDIKKTIITLDDEVKKLLITDYSEAYELVKKHIIFYRSSIDNEDIFIAESGIRIAEMSKNIYTLLISDILPSWQNYPKRNRSFIFTNSYKTAEIYSHGNIPFVILPKNNAKICVCPTADMWLAASKGNLYRYDISSFENFDIYFLSLLELLYTLYYHGKNVFYNKNEYYNYILEAEETIKNYFSTNNINEILILFDICEKTCVMARKDKELFSILDKETLYQKFKRHVVSQLMKKRKMIDILDYLFYPSSYNFKLIELKDLEIIDKSTEFWTESPCLFIRHNALNCVDI